MTKTHLAQITMMAFAAPAFAQDVDAAVDTDGDGMYSFPELQAAYVDITEALFIAIDANADGAVDLAEMAAIQEAGLLLVTDG